MGPIAAVGTVFGRAFTLNGRASRSEFWWFFLIVLVAQIVAFAVDMMILLPLIMAEDYVTLMQYSPFDFVSVYLALLIFIPYITVQVRRLHDAGFSGFWWLLNFVPFGILLLLVFYVLPSTSDTNIWGPPASGNPTDHAGRPVTKDAHQRAMQGYACLFEIDREPTPEIIAARKAEISEYYRANVLKTSQA